MRRFAQIIYMGLALVGAACTVVINIPPPVQPEPPNVAPVAEDQSVTVVFNTPTNIPLVGTDADGDPLTFEIVEGTASGSLTPVEGNGVTYTPFTDFVGADSFTFRVHDGDVFSNTATVTLSVIRDPSAPWALRATVGPRKRSNHALVFDSARNVTMLFGGVDPVGVATAYLGDTWEWNGATWSMREVSGPSARRGHAMAYDSARGVTLLFGGQTGGSPTALNAETWEWNGTTWTMVSTAGPSPRLGHAMAYDSARGVTVLFGGFLGSNSASGETWEWNGSSWQLVATTGPVGRYEHALAYDAVHGQTVLFGGFKPNGSVPLTLGDTWVWDGTVWTQVSNATGPAPRTEHAMAFDSGRGRTVMFGGFASGDATNETWEWDGTSWTQVPVNANMTPRAVTSLAYDAGRGVCVVFGGFVPNAYDNQTWEYSPP